MGKVKQGKSGGARKIGRMSAKCKKYQACHIREKNKLKKVLRSCGRKFAEKWAADHGMNLK
jgi:hypothetical protein